MTKPILILAGGGHSKVLLEVLRLQNQKVIGIVDPKATISKLGHICIFNSDEAVFDYPPDEILLVNGIGSVSQPLKRRQLFHFFKERGYSFADIIHPSAIISSTLSHQEGIQIMAGAIVQTDVFMGENVIVNTRASIDHDCVIGNHVHLAPGVVLSGNVHVGDMVHIGTGATVIQGINIGNDCVVGAGAVVVRDVPDGATVIGVPAREV
ncbi:acetyltransferase [Brevibacillus sp. SYSU BS000544]|uniref:acetyltransferase n=1 Tax=Brevibacillus sp. SYSU BS000544 TaxID=3416443 RepID=UPI003CE4C87F